MRGSYLAGILLASGVSCTYHVFSYNRVVVVITSAVANFSTYDSNSDFSQGIRGPKTFWVSGSPANNLAFCSSCNIIFGSWVEQLDMFVEFCGRVKLTD